MSKLFRLLSATLIVLLAIRCSQSQLTIGSPIQDGLESVTDEDEFEDNAVKRAAWMKIGKRDVGDRYMAATKQSRLSKRSVDEDEAADLTDNPLTRLARSPFLRFGRSPFLRFGRNPSDSTFLRIGRDSSGKTFLRIGRDQEAIKRFLRFGRSGSGSTWLRIGKRANAMLNNPGMQDLPDLTAEELQLIRDNKELLLKLLESSQPHTDGDNGDEEHFGSTSQSTVVIRLLKSKKSLGYFAFPRQGRAMSFYFPRLGRSGEDDTKPAFCCTGVRGVMSAGKGDLEMCPREQNCCPGFTEKTKRYKDIYIVECTAMDDDMDNIRAFIGEE